MKTITVHIGRLVLDGLDVEPRHGLQVKEAVERELSRLFVQAESTAPVAPPTATPALVGGPIHVPERPRPAALGQQIAGAVHTSIGARS